MNHEMLRGPEYLPREGVRSVTGSTFDLLVLAGNGPIVVEFMSYGCAHCRAMEPVLQQVAELLSGKAKIFKVNIAVERALSETFAIDGTPTLVMFSRGREVGRVDGPPPDVSSVLDAVNEAFA